MKMVMKRTALKKLSRLENLRGQQRGVFPYRVDRLITNVMAF